MINVYDRNLRKTAVLQNAFSVKETHILNGIYEFEFSMPLEDTKVEFCKPFNFVRWNDDGALYRIIKHTDKNSDTGIISFYCEHAICTLVDNVLFGSYGIVDLQAYTGANVVYTESWLQWLLSKQTVKRWQLGTCEFNRKFEYGWEQENLLNALYSVAEVFTEPYQWTFDTSHYPWTVNLVKIDSSIHPEYYIRAEKNLLEADTESDSTNIITRIFPLGYGEGINQLTIADANNGIKYLENTAATAEYGLIEKVLVDRRFENADSLKEYAQTILDKLSVPTYSRTFSISDLYELTDTDIDKAEVGKIVKLVLDDTTTYITKTIKNYDVAGDIQVELSTKADNVIDQIAELADRVRIESTYAQGATQLYQHAKDENASSSKGMEIQLYFPAEMKQINKVLANIKIGRFRAYSQATENGGASVQTSSSGGASTQTSSSGGASTQTSAANGGFTISDSDTSGAKDNQGNLITVSTTWSGGSSDPVTSNTRIDTCKTLSFTPSGSVSLSGGGISTSSKSSTGITDGHNHTTGYSGYNFIIGISYSSPSASFNGSQNNGLAVYDQSGYDGHSHTINRTKYLSHSHNISHKHTFSINVGNHDHTVDIPAHDHTVDIPAHDHTVDIPAHSHEITPGIYEFGSASSADIYINGKKKATIQTGYNNDITAWLIIDGAIPRDQWITMEIRPNDLAYINCTIFVQGFVQSRGGGNY